MFPMEIVELPLAAISAAEWNANEMDADMRSRLRRSIQRFGLVVPLVVRATGEKSYQTIGGAQRLAALGDLGVDVVRCVLVQADDVEARLLSESLNQIAGSGNAGLRAELLRQVLAKLPQEEVLALLPESAESLAALTSMGQETIAQHLEAWQAAQAARLKHLQFQLLPSQLEVIEEALARVMPQAAEARGASPNARGTCLFLLCQRYLELEDQP
jgi:ParB family chromosome partitioning protein